ncbi:hypothetical protein MNBD_BACTEROID03-2271 [hydrothermal vent metagenome]|uniref:Lipoprotein n=1 Tax=hydrothermal vent metagenome TaxID=652676 RepID=A0A3B0T7A3_9ZZZZ
MKKSILMLALCSIIQSCTFGKLVDSEKSIHYYIRYGKVCYMYGGNLVPTKINADRKSFVVLSQYIGKDKESIYYMGRLQNVDYPTFRIDQNGIPKDKNYVYKEMFSKVLEPIKIEGVDIESFQHLTVGGVTDSRWSKDKNWYYLYQARLNTDYETTEFAGNDFVYDKAKLFVHFKKYPYLKFVREINEPPKSLTKKYIEYKNKLYYFKFIDNKETEIKEIEYRQMNNLKVINKHVIAINDTVVYYGIKIPHFHAATFEKIKDNEQPAFIRYYKDKNYVYLDTKIIKQADPKTFVMLGYSIAKDDKHVFYEENILEGADSKSFRKGKNLEWIDDHGNRFDLKGKRIISTEDEIESQTKLNNTVQTKIETNQSHFKIDSGIKITFTVTNNSNKEYDFCYWQTPLEKSFTSNFFEITFDDKIIAYSGMMVKRTPPKKTDYLVLKSKQSISETINLIEGYAIDKKGKYKIIFRGSTINGLQDSDQIEFTID